MESLKELLTEEIRDLYDAEKQLVKALPRFAKAASNQELRAAFTEHLEVTKGQVARLEQVFELLGEKTKSKPCKAMKGLLEEGREILQEDAEEALLDSAMIGAAQKVEHYEISGYGTARTLARAIGSKEAAQLLDETLKEEADADKKLTQIALRILKEAQRSAGRPKPQTEFSGLKSKSSTSGRSGGAASKSSGRRGGASESLTTTDHAEIQRWAEERGAEPSCVRGTGGKGDTGLLRLDFPGYSGSESLEHISWDEFFEKFDTNGLALLYQEKTNGGEKSNFNKLVARKVKGQKKKTAKRR
ncbi:MAG TPA: ferritin-like domain-containing protein [Bryobacteraceae bacterium]|nr:ferritin-like domain-containing protein [Bryobacteraceae bacterium]